MKCPKCNWENQPNAHYCSNCTQQLVKLPPFYKRHKVVTVLGSIFLVVFLLLIIGFVNFIKDISNEIENESASANLVSGSGENTIALINVDGVIVENDPSDLFSSSSGEYTSARSIKKVLQEVGNDTSVKAILLRVNSPGGSAAASDEIYSDIKRFKEEKKIPVVAYFTDLAASGGYYIAMSSDKIVANPSAITGSIGVILSYLNIEELAKTYGVTSVVYKSGPYKDIVSNFRSPSQEESTILQSVVDDAYVVFVNRVSEGRKLETEKTKELADGRIYSAQQAKTNGLLDATGTFEDAVAEARKLANIETASVIEFGKGGFLKTLLGSTLQKLGSNPFPSLGKGARVLYLYNPGL